MTSILNTRAESNREGYIASKEYEARLKENYPAPEQHGILEMITNRVVLGSRGLTVVIANQTEQGKGYGFGQPDLFFDKLGSKNVTVSLNQEPSVELAGCMRETRTNLIRLREEFIDKIAGYLLGFVDGISNLEDFPEGLTAPQLNAYKTISKGFVANVAKTLRLVASVRKGLHQERDKVQRKKKLIEGLKTSRLLDLGFTNAKAQLDHNLGVVTGYFPPEYLLDNFWQVQVAESYFGMDKKELYNYSLALMNENGVQMVQAE